MTRSRRRGLDGGLQTGLALIVIGTLFLLHRLDVIHVGRVWMWLPYVLIGVGLLQMVMWASAEQVGSGFGLALFGTWFLITVNGWFGFDWSNSWPLALVAIGLSMVLRALLEPLFRGPSGRATPEGGSDA